MRWNIPIIIQHHYHSAVEAHLMLFVAIRICLEHVWYLDSQMFVESLLVVSYSDYRKLYRSLLVKTVLNTM